MIGSLVPLLGLYLGATIDFERAGAVAGRDGTTAQAVANARVLNRALAALVPGDTLVVPNKTFVMMGGVIGAGLHGVTLQLDGTLKFSDDIKAWPVNRKKVPLVALTFTNSTELTITSNGTGTLDGSGNKWWGLPGIGYLTRGKNRPPLMAVNNASGFVLERVFFLNSARFNFISSGLSGATIRHCAVSARRTSADSHTADDLTAFNTDGFDVSGRNIHVHDCDVWNQDDTFAVKANDENTENVLIENVRASGVGLTIGSIGGWAVNNVTFRNVVMHHTEKGIYMKFRAFKAGSHGTVSNVLYENILIDKPASWPIWIGPAQQDIKEASGPYNPCHGTPCSLCWPTDKSANCDAPPGLFENITLRNVTINNPADSPGVIFGNISVPIKGLVFDGVRVNNPPSNGHWGKDYYYCKGVGSGIAIGDTWPVPPCFENQTGTATHPQPRLPQL